MKKFISKIKNNVIKNILISSFSPNDLGFVNKGEVFENKDVLLLYSEKVLFCHLKKNILENEKKIVRNFIDENFKSFIFVGKGREIQKSSIDGFIIVDHVNMSGKNPLRGTNEDNYGVRFPDMGGTYKLDFSENELLNLNIERSKLLIPQNINQLSKIENNVLEKNSEFKVLSEETYFGVITAKHANCNISSLLLKNTKDIRSLFI